VPWLVAAPDAPAIAVTSRIRLARNLDDVPFPQRCSQEQRQDILLRIVKALTAAVGGADRLSVADMTQLSDLERRLLFERRLISQDLLRGGRGSGVAVGPDEAVSVMINEEDHLRLQVLLPGNQLRAVYQLADDLDNRLARALSFAFRTDLGFLTSCPSNAGSGLRASLMLHLPALALAGQVEAVVRAARNLNLTIRGLFGEGTEATGNFFQVSNQSTLGEPDETILQRLEAVVARLITAEQAARQQLAATRPLQLADQIGRAYGILRHAHLLSSQDATNHLSMLLLGCDLGMFSALKRGTLLELMVTVQPGHLQKLARQALDDQLRDVFRARLLRRHLGGAG
jgi:protein arginine kinase